MTRFKNNRLIFNLYLRTIKVFKDYKDVQNLNFRSLLISSSSVNLFLNIFSGQIQVLNQRICSWISSKVTNLCNINLFSGYLLVFRLYSSERRLHGLCCFVISIWVRCLDRMIQPLFCKKISDLLKQFFWGLHRNMLKN